MLGQHSLFSQPNPAIFDHISNPASGFTQNEVKDVLKDRDGFLWIATTAGLFRYDGHDMRLYQQNPLDSSSLGGNFVICLALDADSAMWVGTLGAGLFRYDRFKDGFEHFPFKGDGKNASLFSEINDLLLDSQGRIWAATKAGLGLIDRETKRLVSYPYVEGDTVKLVDVSCLIEDSQQQIWAGIRDRNGGFWKVYPEKEENILLFPNPARSGIRNNRVISLAKDEEGNVWFSTEDTRLHRLDPGTHQIESFTFFSNSSNSMADIQAANIWAIEPNRKGELWLGTHARGLIHFSPNTETQTYYQHDPLSKYSLASDAISVIYLDSLGVLWIGYTGSGLSQLNTNPSGFGQLSIDLEANLQNPGYKCVLEDRLGKVWVGSWVNGLYCYDLNAGQTNIFKHQPSNPQGLASNMIWDIMEDRKGCIWIATHGGLQRLDSKQMRFETFGQEHGLKHEAIRSLYEDGQGTIWIGTFGGLHRMDADTGEIQFVDEYSSNPYGIVNKIVEDSQQQLWVAVIGQGIFRLDSARKRWIAFQYDRANLQSLNSNIVLGIVEDSQDRLWLGTQGGGLHLLTPHPSKKDSFVFRHWRSYNSDLPTDNIFNLGVDQNDHLWLSTDRGLFAFDPKEEQITPYSLPSKAKGLIVETELGRHGYLYVGNAQNIYRFHPGKIRKNKHIPSVFITDILIREKSIPIQYSFGDSLSEPSSLPQAVPFTSSLTLGYDQRDVTFVFSALNFIQPSKNEYAYQLKGYDKGWIKTDAFRRNARYTNLPPGSYTFRVKAANNDRVWNEVGTSLQLTILPPWWQTWWAYVIYGLVGFLIVRLLYGFQLNRRLAQAETQRLKELDTAKSRMITNVTHDFRTPLTVILGMAQQIKENPAQWLAEGIDAITRNGRQVLTLVNQMLDLSRLEAGNWDIEYRQGNIMAYLGYLVESLQSYAESKKVHLQLTRNLENFQMDFAPDALSKVINNLLSNAIKFTPENGKVEVEILGLNHRLEIRIQDNGIGIPPAHLPHIFDRFYQVEDATSRVGEGTGIGLALVKELLELMRGEIEVQSEPMVRTVFQLSLSVSKKAPPWSEEFDRDFVPQSVSTPPAKLVSNDQDEAPLVLIVEDNADVATYTASCLQNDYRISLAENGRLGIEKALKEVPDMIICDVMMPEADGYEVCKTLKQDERTSHIPIIMLTAKADDASRIEGLRQGAEVYLAKPFHREELEVRMEKLIEIRRELQKKFASFPEVIAKSEGDAPKEDAFLQKLRKCILQHIEEEGYGISALCRDLAISRTQLHRKLKALTGRPTSHVIRSIRLQKAKELIGHTDLNISEIAFQTGFGNHSYFSALFAEEFGQTPSEMREKSELEQ